MVLEFICSNEIVNGNEIPLPSCATHYRCKNGFVRFFYFNERESFEMPKTFLIPFRAKTMNFNSCRNCYNMNYGVPEFYDLDGQNILKRWEELFNHNGK